MIIATVALEKLCITPVRGAHDTADHKKLEKQLVEVGGGGFLW